MRRSCTLFPLLSILLLVSACGGQRSANYDAVYIQELEAQVADQKGQLAAKDAEIASLQSQAAAQPVTKAESDPMAGLEGTGAEAAWRNGELVITIANDILFASGSATLTEKAKGSLRQIAQTVTGRYAGQFVRVEGHTDNQPIQRTRDKWADNWDLAGNRAMAVLRELIDRGGIPKDSISFAGYSDTKPRDSNGSASGRSKNRRVEIVVLPAQRQ